VNEQQTLSLSLEGRLDSLAALDEGIDQFAERCGLPRPVVFDLRLVLEELFVNVVNYAYQGLGDAAGTVSLRLTREPGGVAVELRDGGAPFDPTARAAKGIPAPGETEGGFGIFLVARKTRGLAYERLEEGVNRLTFSVPVPPPGEIGGG